MAVLAAEKPEIVYVHLNTSEEAEEVQKKILGNFCQKLNQALNSLNAFS